jgi:hypothetical protein
VSSLLNLVLLLESSGEYTLHRIVALPYLVIRFAGDSFNSFDNRMNENSYDQDAVQRGVQSQLCSTMKEEDDFVGYLTDESTGEVHSLSKGKSERVWNIGRLLGNWICIPDDGISV